MPHSANGNLRVRPKPTSRAGVRLTLVEAFLASDDLEACAQMSVEWLFAKAGVPQSLCLILEREGKKLVGTAGAGVNPAALADYDLDLADAGHPLVKAVVGNRPVYFPRGRQPHTPLDGSAFHALPLRTHQGPEGPALGLLLVSAGGRIPGPDTLWVSEVLSAKLVRLHSGEVWAESKLGRERNLLYNLINSVTDPILLTDTEGKLITANSRAEKLFGAPADASEGWRRAVGLNNMLFSSALTSTAIDQAATSPREILLVDPIDGSDLLYELLTSTVRDPREGTRVVSILRNVSDLKRAMVEIEENYRKLRMAEAEVRAERHRLDLIIDSVADPIVVTDPGGETVLMNAPAERLFTVRAGGGKRDLQLVRANDAHFSSFVSNLLFSGTDTRWRGEIGLVDPVTGLPMPVEAVAGKIQSGQGELTAVVTILHDRTEAIEKAKLYEQLKKASGELELKVKKATAELGKQNELLRRQAIELEQASALKSQFLANMSHEFRTPLNAILGYTSMMLQGIYGETPPAQKKSLLRIDSNSRHLLSIINEILDITRIEAGRMPLHLREFGIKELLTEVFSELDPMISRSKLEVTTELGPRLPTVRSDRQKVKQIVLNLISNALKFTHQGSIRVIASYGRAQKRVAIAVSDTGIGIAAQDQAKVFEDFRQLDSTPARAYGGTGLGLSICRRLAHMLDGKITLSSKPGKGSTFTLHLPTKTGKMKGSPEPAPRRR